MKRLAIVGAIAIGSTIPRPAVAEDCRTEAAALRALLRDEAHRAKVWNVGWAVAFGAFAVGSVVMAKTETKPLGTFDDDYKELLYTSAAKASIGLASRVVLPLRIAVPAPVDDACVDVAALRRAAARAGKLERRNFYLNHFGGLAVNLGGVAFLAARRNAKTAAASFALGFPVGLFSTYSQPRGTWHHWRARRASWTVGVSRADGATTAWLAGGL